MHIPAMHQTTIFLLIDIDLEETEGYILIIYFVYILYTIMAYFSILRTQHNS